MINTNEYEYIKIYKCVCRTPLAFEFCHNLSFQFPSHVLLILFISLHQKAVLTQIIFILAFFFLCTIYNYKLLLPCCPPTGQYPKASSSHLLLQVPLQLYMTKSVHWKIICLLSLFCLSNETRQDMPRWNQTLQQLASPLCPIFLRIGKDFLFC